MRSAPTPARNFTTCPTCGRVVSTAIPVGDRTCPDAAARAAAVTHIAEVFNLIGTGLVDAISTFAVRVVTSIDRALPPETPSLTAPPVLDPKYAHLFQQQEPTDA